jgi:hypothetical protein
MKESDLDPDDIFRFGNIVYDVGVDFGSTTDQALARCRRAVNRAMLDITRKDRRWTWMNTVYDINTAQGVRIYSLDVTLKKLSYIWVTGLSRQKIDRIPTGKFVELVPNPELSQGIPRLYDEEGVDSQGALQISLYPVPSGIYALKYRGPRKIVPIKEDETDVRAWWGMPDSLHEALLQKAAAFACRGVNNAKSTELNMAAEALIEDEYDADQAKPGTSFRAPMGDEWDMISDGPMLPPQFGNW